MEPSESSWEERRYCQRCLYEVTGLESDDAACPECGRPFDPADPRSTLSRLPTRIDRLFNRSATIPAIILIILGVALWKTWLPRPISLDEWRVWLWMNEAYGVEHTWLNADPIRIRWTGDRAWAVGCYDNVGNLRWRVERVSADRFRIDVREKGVGYQSLLHAFNAVKVDLVGLQIQNPASQVSTSEFFVEGTRIEVIGALMRHYGLSSKPFLIEEDQSQVWYFDADLREFIALPVEDAQSRLAAELGESESEITTEVPTYSSGWFTPPR